MMHDGRNRWKKLRAGDLAAARDMGVAASMGCLNSSWVEQRDGGFGAGEILWGVEIGEPAGGGGLSRFGDGVVAEKAIERLAVLQRKDMGCGFEDGQELELAESDGGGDGWSNLLVQQADCGLRTALDGKHGDAIGFGWRSGAGGPVAEDGCGQEGHVDGENEVPVAGGVSECGFDAADRAAVGVQVGDERSVGGERGIAAEDEDLCADASKFGDGVGDERLAGELKEGLVRSHARASAAGEDVTGDGE